MTAGEPSPAVVQGTDWLTALSLPQIWIPLVLALVVVIKSFVHRQKGTYLPHQWRAPSIDDVVELAAYFAGLYGVKRVLSAAYHEKEADLAVAMMLGGLLLAFVSIRGVWRTFTKPPETVQPQTVTQV
jgi:hypothetical protein